MENESIFEKIKSLNLNLGEYAVVSGGVLEARGIRKSGDIDLLVTRKVFEQLANEGWEIFFKSDKFILYKDEFEVAMNCNFGEYTPDTNSIIQEADIIDGCAFESIDELIKFKQAMGREKDKNDLELLEEYLKNMPTEHHSQP
jgi:AAA+ superfamily predicted ATPase